MSDQNTEQSGTTIIDAVKNSLDDARDTVQKLAEAFKENVRILRVEESKDVFLNLGQNIADLQYFMEFIKGLNVGLEYIEGVDMPADPIISNNDGLDLFNEMNTSLEAQDWVMLADIVEYELAPLLSREDEWLGNLDEKLGKHEG